MKTYLIIYFTLTVLAHCVTIKNAIDDDDFREVAYDFIGLILTVAAVICFGKLT